MTCFQKFSFAGEDLVRLGIPTTSLEPYLCDCSAQVSSRIELLGGYMLDSLVRYILFIGYFKLTALNYLTYIAFLLPNYY